MKTFKYADTLYDLRYLSSPVLSDDECTLYYVDTFIDSKSDSYTASIIAYNLQTNSERILIANGATNKSPIIHDNHLYYLSNLSGSFQIYSFDLTNSKVEQLTTTGKDITSLQLNKSKNSLIYTTTLLLEKDSLTSTIKNTHSGHPFFRFNTINYNRDGSGYIDNQATPYLCEFSLDTHSVNPIAPQTTGYGLRRHVDISSDGRYYLYERPLVPDDAYNSDSGVFIYDSQTAQENPLNSTMKTGIFGDASLSANDEFIAMIGNPLPYKTANQLGLYLYNRVTQSLSPLAEQSDIQFIDNSVSDLYQNVSAPLIQWHPSGEKFYTLSSEWGNVVLKEVTLEGKLKTLSPANSVIKEYIVSQSGDIFAVISQFNRPATLYHYDGQHWNALSTSVSRQYEEYHFGQYQSFETLSQDGGTIHGLLSLPYDFDPSTKYPLILNIHGGPYTMHAWNFYHEAQYLSANGYIVLLVNPRGSYGYGQQHSWGVHGRYGQEDYQDLMNAMDYILETYSYVDANNLFVTGGSYGGYMTNWIVTQTNRFNAAVSQRSMSNFVSMFSTSDIGYHFYKDELNLDLSQADKLWQLSPLAYVDRVETPLLLIHSEKDLRCPLEQAQQFYVGLKHYGKEAELLIFPNSSHELSRSGRPSYRIERLKALVDWFERFKQ